MSTEPPVRDPGPHPVVRALVGLLLGVAAGALVAFLTPRPERATRPVPPPPPQPPPPAAGA